MNPLFVLCPLARVLLHQLCSLPQPLIFFNLPVHNSLFQSIPEEKLVVGSDEVFQSALGQYLCFCYS